MEVGTPHLDHLLQKAVERGVTSHTEVPRLLCCKSLRSCGWEIKTADEGSRTAKNLRPAVCFSALKDSLAEHFLERRVALLDLLEARHAEADHAFLDGLALELDG